MNANRRRLLGLGAALPFAGLWLPRLAFAADAVSEAVVDAAYTGRAGAQVEGKPTFASIQAALEAAPSDSDVIYRLHLRAGRYHEKISINRDKVQFVGAGRDTTVLSFDAYAGQVAEGSINKWGTAGCATLIVEARDFTARDMTIENAFDYLGNDAKPADDKTRVKDTQAVALMTSGSADRCAFFNVRVAGYQDTLLVNAGRSYFRDCQIAGNVDFIFGGGIAAFDHCDIVCRPRAKPGLTPPLGYVSAPSTSIQQKYGLVFLNCRILRESDQVPPQSFPLGRPWHPSGDPEAIGQAVYIDCFMDVQVAPEGWASMSSTRNGERIWFKPEDSRFFEYRSSGPGALVSDKRRQLSDAQAADYTLPKILGDWQPA